MAGRLDLVVLVDSFPTLSETFVVNEVLALQRLGHRVRVEAAQRAPRPSTAAPADLRVNYLEDDSIKRRLRALIWLALRHPVGCGRDLLDRLRWRRDEPPRPLRAIAPVARRLAEGGERHLHVHFAAGAALDALRLHRLLGVPYSVTAHAYDIFKHPRNLAEKIERAVFTTTGCEYNVAHLRDQVDAVHAERIHKIVMGVEGERFRRRTPYRGGATVAAVGRLVEKKGFGDLIEATALAGDAVRRLVIVGDGPLRTRLEEQGQALGLGDRLDLLGAREPDEVRRLLEETDVLAMPCVVAADGDRDSMPVVVKEALAMEVPVVATAEVGLPELVRPEWGRLVPPHDPGALAEAIGDLLATPVETRAAMGRAGREWVLDHANVDRETARLSELISEAALGSRNQD